MLKDATFHQRRSSGLEQMCQIGVRRDHFRMLLSPEEKLRQLIEQRCVNAPESTL